MLPSLKKWSNFLQDHLIQISASRCVKAIACVDSVVSSSFWISLLAMYIVCFHLQMKESVATEKGRDMSDSFESDISFFFSFLLLVSLLVGLLPLASPVRYHELLAGPKSVTVSAQHL